MRKIPFILVFAFFAACAEKSDKQEITQFEEPANVLENMTLSVDTLIIDPEESIISIGNFSQFGQQNYSSLSQDGNFLYLFDRKRLIVQEIDLNSLKLTKTYSFEQEGPNGVGKYVFSFEILPSGDFFMQDIFMNVSIFSKSGEKIRKIELNGEDLLQGTRLNLHYLDLDLYVDFSLGKFYNLPRNLSTREMVFAILDSTGQTGKIYEIPKFSKYFDFLVSFNSGDGGSSKGEKLHLQKSNDLVILSSSFGSGVYVYHPRIDSLYFKVFPHELTPLEKDVELKNEVFSQKEFQAELDKLHTQIDYFEFYWDETSQRYYRFARLGLPIATVDSPKRYEHYLFAYNKTLELTGETKLTGISELPQSGFFKDGRFWTYVNVEEELGFAVMDFDF